MQGNGKGEETRNMLGYAKGTDARKYKGQGKARERQRHSINENEKTHSLTRSHEKGRKRDHTLSELATC